MNDLSKTTLFPLTATLKRLVLRSGTGGETHYSIRRRSDGIGILDSSPGRYADTCIIIPFRAY
jgi:hypothetical protein